MAGRNEDKRRSKTKCLITAAIGLAAGIAGCASVPDEERTRASRVGVVSDSAAVQGCRPVGSVTDDDVQDLQRKAVRLGGDVALVTMQSQTSRGAFGAYGGGFRTRTLTTAE